jgi:hypothetical protein
MSRTNLWAKVKEQIRRGEFPPVFVTADGRLGLDGIGATLPADVAALYPAPILEAAEAKRAAVVAAEKDRNDKWLADLRAKEQATEATKAQYRHQRIWRLGGLYVEDQSTARYTLAEIEGWLDWDAYNLRHNRAQVTLICERPEAEGGAWVQNISERFANACNDRRPVPTFAHICERLATYVATRRADMSGNN